MHRQNEASFQTLSHFPSPLFAEIVCFFWGGGGVVLTTFYYGSETKLDWAPITTINHQINFMVMPWFHQ